MTRPLRMLTVISILALAGCASGEPEVVSETVTATPEPETVTETVTATPEPETVTETVTATPEPETETAKRESWPYECFIAVREGQKVVGLQEDIIDVLMESLEAMEYDMPGRITENTAIVRDLVSETNDAKFTLVEQRTACEEYEF